MSPYRQSDLSRCTGQGTASGSDLSITMGQIGSLATMHRSRGLEIGVAAVGFRTAVSVEMAPAC